MASEKTSGSQTAAIGTEHVLATVTDAGVYEFNVDTRNMAAGDVVELRIYKAIRTGDSRYLAYSVAYSGVQGNGTADAGGSGETNKISPPIVVAWSARFSLKQTAGTGRAFPWSVHEV